MTPSAGRVRAFVALGANAGNERETLERALHAMDVAGLSVGAVARPRWTPFEGAEAPDVLNTVAEVFTLRPPRVVLDTLQAIEAHAGRDRSTPLRRTLDLDLLAHGGASFQEEDDLRLPHPRALARGFVLEPWAEIAPLAPIADAHGRVHPVVRWRASLRAASPEAFAGHRVEASLALPPREDPFEVLLDRDALAAWRASVAGRVGVVPTMGALHEGHATLARTAVAACDHVVATLFVNPLQFAPGEDLDRYPRTFEADCTLLRATGVQAVYAPTPQDLYAPDFSTYVVPEAMAQAYEGATRPTHFRGVTTVVCKLLNRVRADRAYFGRKDAQQVAIVQRMHRDLDLPGTVQVCATVRDGDGLALSSRNQYLTEEQRKQALGLRRALTAIRDGATDTGDVPALVEYGTEVLAAHDLAPDYVAVVSPDTMQPLATLSDAPALAIGAVRVGAPRLLDNTWVARPVA